TCSFLFFFSSRRRHTRFKCDWSSDVCSSDLCRRRRVRSSTYHVASSSAAELRVGRRQLQTRCRPGQATAARGAAQALTRDPYARSEERRVGKECRTRGGRVGWREEGRK